MRLFILLSVLAFNLSAYAVGEVDTDCSQISQDKTKVVATSDSSVRTKDGITKQ